MAAFKGTDYQRPEDTQIQTVRDKDCLYVTTTSTHEVYRLELKNRRVSVFADRNAIDLARGAPVGNALASPDNLAIDHEESIYIGDSITTLIELSERNAASMPSSPQWGATTE